MGKRFQRLQHSLELGKSQDFSPQPAALSPQGLVAVFCSLDHFGSCLSDKPFCSEVTPLR